MPVGGLADKVVSLDGANFARWFAVEPEFSAGLTAHIRSFDAIVSYLHDSDGVLKRNLLHAGVRHLVCGSPQVTALHAIDTLLKPLEELGIHGAPGEYARLDLPGQHLEAGRKRMAEFGEKVVAFHPGSGSPKKNWPLPHFIALAERLKEETGLAPVFTLGEADDAIARDLRTVAPGIPTLPPCSLLELTQFLSACRAYVGNDSGITHLAAATGIPVVALFGPTEPRLWAPRGPNVTVLSARDGMASLSTGEVWEAMGRNLECLTLNDQAPTHP